MQVAASAAGVIAYTHDLLDRPLSVTAPEGIVTYTYDVVGRRSSMTVSGQQQMPTRMTMRTASRGSRKAHRRSRSPTTQPPGARR
jgi:YD repeat-containing protein